MPRSVTHVRRTPRSVEVWPSASSVFRHQNGQQDLAARPPRCHRSEARLSQCIEHLPSRSRSTRRLPFLVCMAQRLSPLSSCLPSLCGAFLFPALPWHPARNSIGSRPPQYYEGSDCCHRSPQLAALPAFLATPSRRSAPKHLMPPQHRFLSPPQRVE